MTQTMYHGTGHQLTTHHGLCLTTKPRIAASYAMGNATDGKRTVHQVELNLDALTVVEVDGYDRDENIACGDGYDTYNADVIVYADEDYDGREHATYRLMSDAALAALTYVTAIDAEDV